MHAGANKRELNCTHCVKHNRGLTMNWTETIMSINSVRVIKVMWLSAMVAGKDGLDMKTQKRSLIGADVTVISSS